MSSKIDFLFLVYALSLRLFELGAVFETADFLERDLSGTLNTH